MTIQNSTNPGLALNNWAQDKKMLMVLYILFQNGGQ